MNLTTAKTENFTLSQHQELAQKKLAAARLKVKLFAMDYDGTLANGEDYGAKEAVDLIGSILAKGKTPAFITARAATAMKTFLPLLLEHYKAGFNLGPTYLGGGNGTVLYKIDSWEVKKIYSYGLSANEIKNLVKIWQIYAGANLPLSDLSEKGLKTFNKFYSEDWQNLIPGLILEIGRPFLGQIFTEEAKLTFVLPKDVTRHKKVVDDMQALVGEGFSVAAGDRDFCHITKSLKQDSKLLCVKTILDLEHLSEEQLATFGDMPHGNDAGLLSFKNSFTNYIEAAKIKDLNSPPFILPEAEKNPVFSVHKAVGFLVS